MSRSRRTKKNNSPDIEEVQYDLEKDDGEDLFPLTKYPTYHKEEDTYNLTLTKMFLKRNKDVIEYYENLLQELIYSVKEFNRYEQTGFEEFYDSSRSEDIIFIRGAGANSSSNRTLYNFSDLDMRSLLFKNVRLGMSQEAMYDMVEIYTLSKKPIKNADKVFVTNMNQLLANACRYAGPTALAQIIAVATIYNAEEKLPLSYVLSMVDLLSQSDKNPIVTYIWFAYVTPLGRSQAESKAPHLLAETSSFNDEEVEDVDKFYEGDNLSIDSFEILRTEDYFLNSERATSYLIAFAYNIYNKNDRAYSWLYYYLTDIGYFVTKKKSDKVDKNVVRKLGIKIPINKKDSTNQLDLMLWLILENYLPPIVYQPLITLYYRSTTKDRIYFLALATICAIYRDKFTCPLLASTTFLEEDVSIQVTNLQYYLYENHNIDGNSRIGLAQVNPIVALDFDPSLETIYRE